MKKYIRPAMAIAEIDQPIMAAMSITNEVAAPEQGAGAKETDIISAPDLWADEAED